MQTRMHGTKKLFPDSETVTTSETVEHSAHIEAFFFSPLKLNIPKLGIFAFNIYSNKL